MGYVLLLLPVESSEEPISKLKSLQRAAYERGGDPLREARNRRLVRQLVDAEPQLHIIERQADALAEAVPEASPAEVAQLARTLELGGWPGVAIEIADDWASVEVAAWPDLDTEPVKARIARILTIISQATGWSIVDAERGDIGDAYALVDRAVGAAATWGRTVDAKERATKPPG